MASFASYLEESDSPSASGFQTFLVDQGLAGGTSISPALVITSLDRVTDALGKLAYRLKFTRTIDVADQLVDLGKLASQNGLEITKPLKATVQTRLTGDMTFAIDPALAVNDNLTIQIHDLSAEVTGIQLAPVFSVRYRWEIHRSFGSKQHA